MNKAFFIKYFFLPAAFFSLSTNLLLLTPSIYMFQLYDRVIVTRSEETLWLLTILLMLALLVMGLLEIVRTRLLARANDAIDAMLAPALFKKMAEEACSPEGNQYSYALRDLHTIKTFLTGHSILTLFDAPWLPIYVILLYFMSPLFCVVLLVGSLLMLALTVGNELLTKKSLDEAGIAGRDTGRFVESSIRNAEVANAMGMLDCLTRRWKTLNNRALTLQNQAGQRSSVITGLSKFARQAIQALGMGVGTYIILKEPSFTPGMLIAGSIIFSKALGPIEMAIGGWKGLLEARSAYSRLAAFVAARAKEERFSLELPAPTGQISLDRVIFGIRSANKVILKDVSFALAAGDVLGVIGPSASGKSSLARVLVGVWTPLQGAIRLDGAEMHTFSSERLGRYVGYLPQDIELFAGTIADNIARLEEPETNKVLDAARMAGLHEMILHLPEGYDTQIGEGGAVLSGGQRQRIALARALYDNPRIVVLDEPNSNLDTQGEAALIGALLTLKQKGATTVVITHKLNLLAHVDKLLVMQNGGVAAFGPRDWVMAQLTKAQPAAGSAQESIPNQVQQSAQA